MPIDVTVPGSPGWWMERLYRELRVKRDRLQALDNWRRGRVQLVFASKRQQTAFYQMQNMCRVNLADQIITSRTGRMTVRSIRTAASSDDRGDQTAWRMYTANRLELNMRDFTDHLALFGEAFLVDGMPTADGGQPVITVEDPRQMVLAADPINPLETLAAFKLFHDGLHDMDYAYLWLKKPDHGEMWVARRERKAAIPTTGPYARWGVLEGPPPPLPVSFNPKTFDLLPIGQRDPGTGTVLYADDQLGQEVSELPVGDDGPLSEVYDTPMVPVYRAGTRLGVGEFEMHTDLMNRINHEFLNGMIIATYQAFKQRGIETSTEAGEDGGLPDEDENGQQIDYNDVFAADPGALWRLPIGAKIWESGQVDMSGILAQTRELVLTLSNNTFTPFPAYSSDATNQSANSASLYREGLAFRIEDLCAVAGVTLAHAIAGGFRLIGDDTRADPGSVIIDWAPADRYSILEKAQADGVSTLPLAAKLRLIYGMSPDDILIVLAQHAQEQFTLAALGQSTAPGRLPLRQPQALPAGTDPAAGQ